jgi:type I restriction enzyme R subunit
MREKELNAIIEEARLNPEETRKFIENAFRDGEVKTTGTDIDKIMPPMSRFGGGREEKKKEVIEKLLAFYIKYSGVGVSESILI